MPHRPRAVPGFALLLLILAACGPSGPAEPPTVVLTDNGCERSGAESLPAGPASITVRNESGSPGNFELLRLEATYPGLVAHVAEEQARIAAGQQLQGPPASVSEVSRLLLSPTESGTIEATLTPGTHAVVCTGLSATQVLSIFVVGPYSVGE